MFNFIYKKFLHRFIIVYLQENSAFVHLYDMKDLNTIDSDIKNFELEKKDELTEEIVDFINSKQNEVGRSYIVTLVNSLGQGIIPTCDVSMFKNYNIDKKYIYNICIDGNFTNYATKTDIKWIQKIFKDVGIDFIFSPFIALKKLIDKENKNNNETILYILYHNLYSTLIVYKQKKYIYGNFFYALEDKNPLYSDFENDDKDEIEEVFDIDEFMEDDFEDEINLDLEENIDSSEDGERDYKKEVELIQENKGFIHSLSSSLKEYYSNKIYESNFVDKIIIFSEDDIDISVIEYIENELFLSVDTIKMDMDEIILELCKEELF